VAALGGVTAPYAAVNTLADLHAALAALGTPAILKTRRMGYDGKGQVRIDHAGQAADAFAALAGAPAVLEGLVRFDGEFSILIARGTDGGEIHYPPVENHHDAGILARSLVPAAATLARHAETATSLAVRIADALGYVGVLACEFFATASGPVFNEMAPRVHNSGHWSIEGAHTSQFEAHIRAVAGLPLGCAALRADAVRMENLLGDPAPQLPALLADPAAHLHLYGKSEAAPGRKMGHVTWLHKTVSGTAGEP
jgi:5-(carboxyamino)imidazole ribonucleotide synthase